MVFKSVWEDTYYSAPESMSPLSYHIEMNGQEIYRGKAYAKPNSGVIDIHINEIVKTYLNNYLSDEFIRGEQRVFNCYDAIRTFSLVNDSNDQKLEEYTFLSDYSFTYQWRGAVNTVLSNPINFRYDPQRQTNVLSTIRQDSNGYYIETVNDSNAYYATCCGNYELVYLNRQGGWDKLLFSIKPKRNDSFKKYQTVMPYNNLSLDFGKNTYLNTIKTSFDLQTDLLTEKEGENLAENLLSSNKVYLFDYEHNKIYPCVIKDEGVSWKTYKNDSTITYNINVELSQEQYNI